ncbi:MAG: hypothetical protein M3083_13560 [Actinomycetota bacterium]|nr:hypothetical protein [Actinomycetota bacterium]
MNIGLWITPAMLAGVCAVLWVTTRLERLVSAPAVDAGSQLTLQQRRPFTALPPNTTSEDIERG